MIEKIKALIIYEILGRPPEHIRITLEQLIDRIGENKGIEILKRRVHEPHVIDEDKKEKIKSKDELYSTFAEVEIEVDNLLIIFGLILNTLPSSVEIISPTELRLKNFDLSSVLAELSIKLHHYDEIAKAMVFEKQQFASLLKKSQDKIKELGGEPFVRFESDEKIEEKEKA